MQKVWVCHTLLDIMPLYMLLSKGKGTIFLQKNCYNNGENKEGVVNIIHPSNEKKK
jgi:hypothetical protein